MPFYRTILTGCFLFFLGLATTSYAQTNLLISGDAGTTVANLSKTGPGFSANGEIGFQINRFQILAGGQMILGLPTAEDADADGYLVGGRLGYAFGSGKGFELPVTAGYMVGELDLQTAHSVFLDVQPSINTGYGFVFGPFVRGGYMTQNGANSLFAGAGLRLTWHADPFRKKKKAMENPTFY